MRILLTSPRAPVALDLARRFHHRGHEVFFCDSLRFGCGNFTRFKQRTFLTPPPNGQRSAYVDAINRIVDKGHIDLLLPTCEEIFFLAAYKDQIECEIFADSLETLSRIHNKWTFSQMSGRVPETVEIRSAAQLDAFRHHCDQFVFKPVYSRFASETLIRPKAECFDGISVSERKPWIAQRFVRGREFSTYSVARQGRLLAHCTYRSSFRAGIGSGVCFQAEPTPAITAFSESLVGQLKFTGQLGLDCIVDEADQLWVIEGNPRSTSGLHLFEEGAPLIDAIMGDETPLVEPSGTSSQMIAAAMLSFGLKDASSKRQLMRYLRKLFTSRDVLFRWSDPLPTLCLPLTFGELCWVAFRERMSLQQASTQDIEWNGEPL